MARWGRGAGASALVPLLVGAVLLMTLLSPGIAAARDYGFPLVEIEATVLPTGDMELVERRTFEFDGAYSVGFFTVAWPQERIRGFRVEEGGREIPHEVVHSPDGFEAEWPFPAQDERRTVTISYTALCAVDVHADAAHLLWQFVGTGWEKGTDLLRVTVRLPGASLGEPRRAAECPAEAPRREPETRPLEPGETRAWGHGPFAGRVDLVDPQTVTYEVGDLRPETFVEGSILFPVEVVPFAAQRDEPARARILAEEQRLADEANVLRRQHRRETGLVRILYGLLPLAMLGLVGLARRRDRVPEVPRMLEEPPEDVHPVVLAVLWSAYRKRLSPKNAYRAQLLHLARTGAVEVQAVGRVSDPEDLVLRLVRLSEEAIDRQFANFLFDGKQTVSMKDIQAKGKRKDLLETWWKSVGTKVKPMLTRMQKGRNRLESWGLGALAVGVGAYGVWRWTGFSETWTPVGLVGWPAFWLIPIAAIGWLVATRIMPGRLSAAARKRFAEWRAFHRFLRRFSTLPEAPALAVTIWERYLVYATALGAGKVVEKQVRALVPPESLDSPWPGAPEGEEGLRLYTGYGHTARVHTPPHAAAAVGWSSGWGTGSGGGGGGGGFSGGGGGGGGGTGGGAR